MINTARCKRIIDGKTYNTETATLIGESEADNSPLEQQLFKTRFGAYFLYTMNVGGPREDLQPVTAEFAQKWMERHCGPEQLEVEFGEMPEGGDPEARVTLRIPETLRRRIARIADDRNQSLNAWLVRAIEKAAEEDQRP